MKNILNPGKNAPVGPYSPIVKAGDFIFLSGQIAKDPETGNLERGDMSAQTRRVMENIKTILEINGLSMEDIVKCNIYMRDRKDFNDMNNVYKEYFNSYPARITVYIADLYEGCNIEIDVIAYCGK